MSDRATAHRRAKDAPRASTGAVAVPIDRGYLVRFTLGNAALEREVLELFAAQMPLYIRQLSEAHTRKAWREATHAIKGSAAAIGAARLAKLARMAEQLDVESAFTLGAEQRAVALAALSDAADEACRYIACLFATP